MKITDLKKELDKIVFAEPNHPELSIYVISNNYSEPFSFYMKVENEIKDSIISDIKRQIEKFLENNAAPNRAEILGLEDLMTNKKGIYQIEETQDFQPFKKMINTLSKNNIFSMDNVDSINGYLFEFNNRGKKVYIFSKVYGITLLSFKKNVVYEEDTGNSFKIFTKKLLKIETHIDMLCFNQNVFSEKITMLEKDFNLGNHEVKIASNMIREWEKNGYLIVDEEKVRKWLNKHPSYSKKLIAIKNKSVVYTKQKDDLIKMIKNNDFYQKKIEIKSKKINISSEERFKNFLTMMNDERVYSSFSSTTYFSEDKQQE